MLHQIVTMASGVLPHPPDQAAEQAVTGKGPAWPHQGKGAGQQDQGDSLGLLWLQEPIYTNYVPRGPMVNANYIMDAMGKS
jgi:hypothetical protein